MILAIIATGCMTQGGEHFGRCGVGLTDDHATDGVNERHPYQLNQIASRLKFVVVDEPGKARDRGGHFSPATSSRPERLELIRSLGLLQFPAC